MRAPVNWLKEYVEVPRKTADLAQLLTLSGTAVESITHESNSDILHLEVTTNRPDCLSLLGIAAEIAAVCGKKLKPLPLSVPKPKITDELPLDIHIQDRKGCPYYMGRIFESAKVAASPSWLVQNLNWMGQKAINQVVDATNFCLFETGQPLHAFDYDKIRDAAIIVRRAKKNEKMTGINGAEYVLDERILVIADSERPIAIAGVMGGMDTQVTGVTQRVVLESAQFDPMMVRRSSRFLKLTTESSYRFERGVDPLKVRQSSDRASALFVKLGQAKPASKIIEAGKLAVPKSRWISLRTDRAQKILGNGLSRDRMSRILQDLGFKVKKKSKTEIRVKTRTQRSDVGQEADLIEEIVRLDGFEKIPSVVPPTNHQVKLKTGDKEYQAIRQLKNSLAAQGFSEAITFSLLSRAALDGIRWPSDRKAIRVSNPLSQEQEFLRPTGLAGLMGVLSHNMNRRIKNLAFFEVGKRFVDDAEDNVLSLALTGEVIWNWQSKRAGSFYYLKGVVENCFRTLSRDLPQWKEEAYLPDTFVENQSLYHGKERLAACGTVHPRICETSDSTQPVYFAEINLDLLLGTPCPVRRYEDLPQYPSVKRDISFVTELRNSARAIQECAHKAGVPFLINTTLFDEYIGKNIPGGKRSLAIALEYQKTDGTFTDDEIHRLHDKVCAALVKSFRVEFR